MSVSQQAWAAYLTCSVGSCSYHITPHGVWGGCVIRQSVTTLLWKSASEETIGKSQGWRRPLPNPAILLNFPQIVWCDLSPLISATLSSLSLHSDKKSKVAVSTCHPGNLPPASSETHLPWERPSRSPGTQRWRERSEVQVLCRVKLGSIWEYWSLSDKKKF